MRVVDERIRAVFAAGPTLFDLLRTVRSRRVGLGFRIDSGTSERHPVTGREMHQELGPNAFVSGRRAIRLSELEEALLAWAGCGPNGLITWDVSLDGGFNQLVDTIGRTAPEPNNTLATDLLVINDEGVFLYRPKPGLREPVLGPHEVGVVVDWYRTGRQEVLGGRPDIDWAMRRPDATSAPLNGPHQYNLNRPGTTWFLPITDAGRLGSGLVDLFGTRHAYVIDEFNDDRPAGLDQWLKPGMLELAVPLTIQEQGVLRTQLYPAGAIVQNIRLAAESLGLGTWCFSGFDSEMLLGAQPSLARGLGFQTEPENRRAPLASGRTKIFGLAGIKEGTCVPSPRYPTPASLVRTWREERFGKGAWGDPGPANHLRHGEAPWKPERIDGIVHHPRARPPEWAWEATEAFLQYCCDTFGQWPVTFNPLVAGFGISVHHVDTDFYDLHFRSGYVTDRIRNHFEDWHSASLDEGAEFGPLSTATASENDHSAQASFR
jgi:nitroreductase